MPVHFPPRLLLPLSRVLIRAYIQEFLVQGLAFKLTAPFYMQKRACAHYLQFSDKGVTAKDYGNTNEELRKRARCHVTITSIHHESTTGVWKLV